MLDPGLRAAVANVEMSPSRLLDRQLSRLSRRIFDQHPPPPGRP